MRYQSGTSSLVGTNSVRFTGQVRLWSSSAESVARIEVLREAFTAYARATTTIFRAQRKWHSLMSIFVAAKDGPCMSLWWH